MRVKAVVPQQSHKFDDLVDMLVVVCFVSDEDTPCNKNKLFQRRDRLTTGPGV